MLIQKINILKDQRTHIEFSEPCGEASMDSTITCPEKAQPEFYTAIDQLGIHALTMCELPTDQSISVSSVSFSYHGDEKILGAKITIKKELKKSAKQLTITTPLKYAEQTTEEAAEAELLPDGCEEVLIEIIKQTKLYIKGKREQTNSDI